MTRVLMEKLARLGRDEDGAALVVTLALFMFMYATVSGVFAVGRQVRDRIHLQNAADAAAYSAAVVQADTLSRIATINRAMSWTYVSLTRRQMDYVTYRWLEEVCKHWEDDNSKAREWAEESKAACSIPLHHGLDFNISAITLYGATKTTFGLTAERINIADSDFRSRWVGGDASFYADRASIARQIEADWETIYKMGIAIDDLKSKYRDRVETAVENVLKANASFEMDRHLILAEEMKSFTKELANDADGEAKFLDYAGYTPGTAFGNSGNAWFVRRATSGGAGFRRGYDFGGRILRAEWKWHSNLWECSEDVHKRTPCTDCGHPSHYRCSCLPGPSFHAEVYADNGNSREKYYETEEKYKARPLVLAKDYFGAAGTITVGIARYNENPWYRVLSRTASIGEGVLGGIFGAFNPYRDVKWSWAFASAKAGYKSMYDSIDSRNYMVHWKDDSGDGTWNLCQSDWDAVFVPVRRAASRAEWNGEEKESEWTYSESAPLKEWVGSVESAEMPNLPGMHDSSGAIKNLNWNRLADLLYH